MKIIKHIFGTILLSALFTGCSKQETADNLPRKDTIFALIDNELGIKRILLGDQIVHDGESNPAAGKISRADFRELDAWVAAGFISIYSKDILGEESQYDAHSYNRKQTWMQKLDKYLMMNINVALTEKGRLLDSATIVKERSNGWAYGKLINTVVDNIVSMELKQQAANHYCIVNAIILTEFTQAGVEINEGNQYYPDKIKKYKVIWLLKYDPFDKSWKPIARDNAEEGQNFNTNNVNQALLSAK